MAQLWPTSLVPLVDPSGDPYAGAKAYFYNQGTTTPQTTYADAPLATARSNPVIASGIGVFPPVFFNPTPGSYRVKVTDADDNLLWDVDGISVPQDADYVPPDAGDTDATLLARTGDLKYRYGTGAHSGWVRAAGRTIGSATSGASERANADAEALFLHLWGADSTLTVGGGRGGSAASDWAANKTIALPDFRDRVMVGLGDMGNSDANLIGDSQVDGGGNNITLGATVGASTVTLSTAQMPSHNHTGSGTTGNDSPDHSHALPVYNSDASLGGAADGGGGLSANPATGGASTRHQHPFSFTTSSTGDGAAHSNVQPSRFATVYIKL